MYDIRKIYKKLRNIIGNFIYLKVVSPITTGYLLSISLMVMIFDAMSIISIMPLIDFIRYGQDIQIYIAEREYAEKLISFYSYFYIPFNLFSLSCLILLLVLLRQTFNLLEVVQSEKVRLQMSRDLSFKCFTSIISASANFIRTIKMGQFSVLCERESNEVSLLYRNFLNLFSATSQITAYFVVMAYISIYSTIIVSVIITLLLYSMAIFLKKANMASVDAVDTRKTFYSSLTENFVLWRLFKFSQALNKENRYILGLATKYAETQLKIVRYNSLARLLIAVLAMAFCIIILNILVQYAKLELTTIAFFGLIFIRLIPLGLRLNVLMSGFAKLEPSLLVVSNALKEAVANEENMRQGNTFNGVFTNLKFRNVSYKYSDADHPALENINLTIPANKITAIVGKSGAGKSTLVDLIPRLIFPTSGVIKIDDSNINDLSLTSLRKNIAFVYQDSVLYDASIKENIKYFNMEASESDFEEACVLSGVKDFIDKLPGKYEYNVFEGGQKLSGGQKQRVILARAFLSKATILIMDEATSALDNESDKNIRQSLRKMVTLKEKTVILIAHRRNTIKEADFVVYIKNGTTVAKGKPQEIFNSFPSL